MKLSLRFMKSRLKHAARTRLNRFQRPTLSTWFFDWIDYQKTQGSKSPTTTYFEFGVASGGSMMEFLRAVELYSHVHHVPYANFKIVGFDSFKGLPPKQGAADDHATWRAGDMAHVQSEVLGKIRRMGFPTDQVQLVEGFFEDSLTPALREALSKNPPDIVTIDCDYYSSTLTVLKWLEPFIKSGTVLYMDDLWAFHGNPDQGELKAIAEINARKIIHLEPCPILGLAGYSFMCSRYPEPA